jgi:hypothetical protein
MAIRFIILWINKVRKLMVTLFVQYIVPFLLLVSLMAIMALKIRWLGGPAILFIIFFLILLGPSLLYALIADNSNWMLFMFSFITALIVIFILWLKFYKNEKK